MTKASKDFSQGKVYVIRNIVNDKVYVGSTTQPLSKRMAWHRRDARLRPYPLYEDMLAHGTHNFYIELLEAYPCENIEQLNKREGEYIRQLEAITKGYNLKVAGRGKPEYYKENGEKIREKIYEYRKNNKAIIAETDKKHYESNKEEILKKKAEYRDANRESINLKQRQRNALKRAQKQLAATP